MLILIGCLTLFRCYNICSELVSRRNLLTSLFRSLRETIRSAVLKRTSGNIVNNFDASSSTASMLAALRFLSTYDDGENVESASLRSKIYDVDSDFGAEDDGGVLSQHIGRSSIARKTEKGYTTALYQYLLRKTVALVPSTLDSFHPVLSHRRYSVCISDLKCVLNVNGIPRYFASYPYKDDGKDYFTLVDEGSFDCALDDWIKVSVCKCGPTS